MTDIVTMIGAITSVDIANNKVRIEPPHGKPIFLFVEDEHLPFMCEALSRDNMIGVEYRLEQIGMRLKAFVVSRVYDI